MGRRASSSCGCAAWRGPRGDLSRHTGEAGQPGQGRGPAGDGLEVHERLPGHGGGEERLLGWEALGEVGAGGRLGCAPEGEVRVAPRAAPGTPRTCSELRTQTGRTPPLPGALAPAPPGAAGCAAPGRTQPRVGLAGTQGARPCPWHPPPPATVALGPGCRCGCSGSSRPRRERGPCSRTASFRGLPALAGGRCSLGASGRPRDTGPPHPCSLVVSG